MTGKVGIDISKKDFTACFLTSCSQKRAPEYRGANSGERFDAFLSWARQVSAGDPVHFCMESTGGYEFGLACHLARSGLLVSVENPRRIKHFGHALGAWNKTDRVDARTIASYALAMEPRPWRLSDAKRRELAELGRHRESLIVELGRVRNHLEHQESMLSLLRRQLDALEKLLKEQIEEVECRQRELVQEVEALNRDVQALLELPGVGFVTASLLVSEMPDVRDYEHAQSWSAQAGLFPRKRESGQWKGQTTMSKAGNAHVRRALYMGATQAMKAHPVIKALAQRLKAKGKKPKQVRVACMRKLLMISYGILKAVSQGKTPFYGFPPDKIPVAA